MRRRFVRMYILMTSLALTAGTALGYWSGQGSAETGFANDCIQQGIFVVYDSESGEHRHFHCFELQDLEEHKAPKPPGPPEFEV